MNTSSENYQPQIFALAQQVISNAGDNAGRAGIAIDSARFLASLPHKYTLDIIAAARMIRTAFSANSTFTCGIINAKSGKCPENCAFCAQSAHHATGAPEYPLVTTKALIDRATMLADAGATRFGIVTSGHSVNTNELERLCEAALQIRSKTEIKLCASLGQLTPETATMLHQAGFSSYHHNLETARSHFSNICSTHEYDEDIATIRIALDTGFRVCAGGILGLGESWEQRIELAATLRDLDVHSIPVNFLTPIAGTRLEKQPQLAPFTALKALAIFRFMLPDKDILVAGGRESTLGDYQSWALMAGANGLMTGNYLTTGGRSTEDDNAMLTALGERTLAS